jgi:GTP-binding protein
MWNGYHFQIVDTGGIVFDDTSDFFAEKIKQQAFVALKEATVAIMVCDGQTGITPFDDMLAEYIRKNVKIPLYLAINKCESHKTGFAQSQEFWKLGLGEPHPVSGLHGTGLDVILDKVTMNHMKPIRKILKDNATNVAIVGRPNVGKSSLLNRYIKIIFT